MRLNKKGISPLIATVLLIGFTIALAAIVIIWGSGFIQRITSETGEKTTKTMVCSSELNFEITRVECKAGDDIVMIDNRGSIDIKGIILRTFDNTGNYLPSALNLGGINKFEVKQYNIGLPVGATKIEAIANVNIEGKEVTCSELIKQKLFSPAC